MERGCGNARLGDCTRVAARPPELDFFAKGVVNLILTVDFIRWAPVRCCQLRNLSSCPHVPLYLMFWNFTQLYFHSEDWEAVTEQMGEGVGLGAVGLQFWEPRWQL